MFDGLSGEVVQALHRFKRMPLGSLSEKLPRGEFFVLNMIYKGIQAQTDRKGIYVSEIAAHLKMPPSAVSRMLKHLTEKGLVEREVDENDRRNIYVFLTEEGDLVRREVTEKMKEVMQRVILKMGEEDTRQLIQLSNQLADLIDEEIEDLRKSE